MDNGAIQSAGIGLFHEICHIINRVGTEHEDRLVEELEKPFAISMVDGTRERHGGVRDIHTYGVWSRIIDPKYNSEKIPLLYDKRL